MIQWIAIGILVVLGLLLLKFDHQGRKIKLVLVLIIGLLIYFSIMNIFSSNSVDLTSPRGVINAAYVYFGWLGQTASNIWDVGKDTVNMVGNAIKVNQTEKDRR